MVIIDWYFWWRGVSNIQSVYTQLGLSCRQTVRVYIHRDIIEHPCFRGLYPLNVIYQTFELFLILWTALCKEWNCDFWLPKVIHGDIHHAFVIWRVIINNFLLLLDFPSCGIVNLLKIKVFFCEANFQERNTTEIKEFWHCVHANRNSYVNHTFPLENYHFDLFERRETCIAEGGLSTLKS